VGENLYLKPQEISRASLRAILSALAVEPLMQELGLAISICGLLYLAYIQR